MALFGFPNMDNSEGSPPPRVVFNTTVIGILLAVLIALTLLMMPRTGGVGVVLLVIIIPALLQNILRLSRHKTEKPKRDGQDIYQVIDQMVDDLDEAELEYLRNRLADRVAEDQHALGETMDNLSTQQANRERSAKR